MQNIRAALCATLLAAAVSAPASAASIVTYTLNASGSGTRVYDDDGDPSNGYGFNNLQGAVISFSVPLPNTAGVSFGSIGSGVYGLFALATGLDFNFEGVLFRPGAVNGAGNVCFDNAGAMFPTSSVILDHDAGCNVVTYSIQGNASHEEFSGVINSISVALSEGSEIPFASVTSIVPEPSTWALMLAGFGLVGYALRRRPRLSYAT